jgi:hypothetical protein
MPIFGPCKNCKELEKQNKEIDKKRLEALGELNEMYEKERQWKLREKAYEEELEEKRESLRTTREEREQLQDKLSHFNDGLRVLNGGICSTLFDGTYYSRLEMGRYGNPIMKVTSNLHLRSINIPEIFVSMADSRDYLYEITIAKFDSSILDDIFYKVTGDYPMTFQRLEKCFCVKSKITMKTFFENLTAIFHETQRRYELLLTSLEPKDENKEDAKKKK